MAAGNPQSRVSSGGVAKPLTDGSMDEQRDKIVEVGSGDEIVQALLNVVLDRLDRGGWELGVQVAGQLLDLLRCGDRELHLRLRFEFSRER